MRPRFHWVLLSATLVVGSAVGQPKEDKPAAKSDANMVEVRFADDSTVKMSLQHSSIEVATRYGKLSVPVTEIRRIEFGLRIPDETAKRIATAVSQLGAPDFKQR